MREGNEFFEALDLTETFNRWCQKAVDIANRYDIEDEETLEELTSSST